MTTPKTKAEQLVRKYFETGLSNPSYNPGWSWYDCKCMAQITVDEVLDSLNEFIQTQEQHNYWTEVKTEIEKL